MIGKILDNIVCRFNKQFTVSVIAVLKSVNGKGAKQGFAVVAAAVYNKRLQIAAAHALSVNYFANIGIIHGNFCGALIKLYIIF